MQACHRDYNKCLETNILQRESKYSADGRRRRYIVNDAFLAEQGNGNDGSEGSLFF